MRIVAISDTHCKHEKIDVPDGDVLVHAGDLTGRGEAHVIRYFDQWLGTLPHKHKLVIAGNHDLAFEVARDRQWLVNAEYLLDKEVVIDGVKFYGAPWTPMFCNWAFMLPRGIQLRQTWSRIPEDTDVLITHGPPKGILDKCPDGFNAGCEELLARIETVRPKAHIFGHIHTSPGHLTMGGVDFYNVSIVNDMYQVAYEPTVIDI